MPATASPSGSADQARSVDAQEVRATIDRALTKGPLPKIDDLEAVEAQLCEQLEALLPLAEQAGASAALLKGVRAHLAEGMGDGLVSARSHVTQLGHDARTLLGIVEIGDEW